MKYLTIFSSFDPKHEIDTYIIHYLEELKKVSDIIFSSDCTYNEKELQKIAPLCIDVIHKKHGEYDFGSYKKGYIRASDLGILKNYDYLILANDSCYGPFSSLKDTVLTMENENHDFWGFTKNTIDIVPHIQSYFVALKAKVFLSEVFENFITTIEQQETTRQIVHIYEHGLTKKLSAAGFSYDSVFKEPDPKKFDNDPVKYWDSNIKKGYPFLKRQIFTRNRYKLENTLDYSKVIPEIFPEYNTELIRENLKKYTIKKQDSKVNTDSRDTTDSKENIFVKVLRLLKIK